MVLTALRHAVPRCPWARRPLDILYHDQEWGVPRHDDRVLFEFLILEGAQAGLSWSTILEKRRNYRRAFDRFDAYIWRFVGGRPVRNAWKTHRQIPAQTPGSESMSRDLLTRGFKFVGPTICYAFMQAVGMVNDHLVTCFRYREIA
jgi:DNA-3-methyladenine glycosylase I